MRPLVRPRKGDALSSTLVVVAVFVVVAVVFIFVYKKLFDVGREEFTEKQCQASLDLTRKFELSPTCVVTAPNPVAIHCSRDFIRITDEKVMKNGDDATKRYDAACPDEPIFESKDKDPMACMPENVVAETMRQCWQQFYEGEVPVFQQYEYDKMSPTNLWSDAKRPNIRGCFICAEIEVEKTGGVSHYGRYLQEAKFKDGKRMTSYYDYLASRKAYCDPALLQASSTDSCFEAMLFNRENEQWVWLPVYTIMGGSITVPTKVEDKSKPVPVENWQLQEGKYVVTFVRRGMMACDDDGKLEGEETPLTFTVQTIPAGNLSRFCDMVFV